MKKIVYYLSPLVVFTILLLILEFLNNMNFLKLTSIIIFIPLFLVAAIIGNLTPTKRKFDFIIAVIAPLSLFLLLFISGFLEAGETFSRFDFDHAFKIALVNWPWFIYLGTFVVVFFASYKPLRILQKKN